MGDLELWEIWNSGALELGDLELWEFWSSGALELGDLKLWNSGPQELGTSGSADGR